jgi:outer membrane protein assembly factor BamC
MFKISVLALLSLSLTGCFLYGKKTDEKTTEAKVEDIGERDIKYYSDKTVTSLEIPPDLTKPNFQKAFRLSKYVSNIKEDVIDFSGKEIVDKKNNKIKGSKGNKANKNEILKIPFNVIVKREGERRWLVVDEKADVAWDLATNFLKSYGFAIKRSNKKIGLIETDFLENHPEIPDQSLGAIRSMLKTAISTQYVLPIMDKYRIRIEPTQDLKKTAIYLSLVSMEEVLTKAGRDDENTIWQSRAKDKSLEAEMLYRLMTFLGSDQELAKQKILKAQENKMLSVKVAKSVNGYAKLVFSLNKYDTWDNIGWALDQLDIDIEDKDIKEGSFYINVAEDENEDFLTRIFGNDAIKKSFQIMVKQINDNITEVYFNNLSEKSDKTTVEFSHKFLNKIAKQF